MTYLTAEDYYSVKMSNIKDLTVAQLQRAIEIRQEIESLQEQLASLGGVRRGRPPGRPSGARLGRPPGVSLGRPPGRRRMSAEGRARIAAAARARWAKYRGGSASETAAAKPGPKRKGFSKAARARLSEAAKARWAKAKASGKTAL